MAAFDTPLMILAVMTVGSTLLMFFVKEVYLIVIFGIIGMVTCFSAAGYWLSSMTNIPGVAWVFGGLGLVDIVWSIAMSVMTAYPSFRDKVMGFDPE